MPRRRLLLWIVAVVALVTGVRVYVDGPLTNALNLRMRTDANGYLIATTGAYTGPDSSLNALGNMRLRTDANGYLIVTFGSAGAPTFTATGTTALQIRTSQVTPPACQVNCGTAPTVAGTDSAMLVTMGASGSPASGFVVTFNNVWAAAPSCVGTSAKSGMVIGKIPIVVFATAGALTVTTNGTAPGTSDVYAIHCLGVQ